MPSREVTSSQSDVHPRLREVVLKHLAAEWRRPISDASRRAFDGLFKVVSSKGTRLVLDSGCGTGMSTIAWAKQHPDLTIVGIDKSEHRLAKAASAVDNVVFARMNLVDFWPLARSAGWRFERQLFLYPNPWPKPEHRLRRWPFHPVLPVALACGGVWEVRTNWSVYAFEMAAAYALVTGVEQPVCAFSPVDPLTPFEKKYAESGHPLWRWVSEQLEIPSRPTPKGS